MSGILPSIIFPGDIRAVQMRLLANAQGTDQTVQACAGLDAPTRGSWTAFYKAVQGYAALRPAAIPTGDEVATTGTLYNQGLAYEKELYSWQQLLSGKQCNVTAPGFDPSTLDPQTPVVTVVKWIALGAAGLGLGYAAAQFAPIVGLFFQKRQQKGG